MHGPMLPRNVNTGKNLISTKILTPWKQNGCHIKKQHSWKRYSVLLEAMNTHDQYAVAVRNSQRDSKRSYAAKSVMCLYPRVTGRQRYSVNLRPRKRGVELKFTRIIFWIFSW